MPDGSKPDQGPDERQKSSPLTHTRDTSCSLLIDRVTVCDLVRTWSEKTPHRHALLTDDNQSLTFRAVINGMDNLRHELNSAGFGRGDRIAIVHPSDARLALVLLGVISGMTAVPLDPTLTEDEFEREFRNRGVDGLLVSAGTGSAARRAAARLSLPVQQMIWTGPDLEAAVHLEGPGNGRPVRAEPAMPNDCAVVLGTSGTTDRSKVVPLRHRTLFAQVAATQEAFALSGEDRCISLNPVFLLSGLQHFLASLSCGGSAIIISSFDNSRFFDTAQSLGPTWFLGSFTFLPPIIDLARETGRAIPEGQFRFLRVTFGRIGEQALHEIEDIFHAPVIEGLGISESGTIASNPLPPGQRKFGTVGLPMSCDIAIIDDQGEFVAAGQQGEILVRGDLVFDGYEGDDAANQQAFLQGWYRTGDMGFLDEDGYLTLIGRVKEMINRGGMKISPDELDQVLCAHPDVLEAASFAIPHSTLGEVPGAAIVWADGEAPPDSSALKQFLRTNLAPFKVPVGFLTLDSLPRGHGGKILRRRLTEIFISQR